MKYFLLITLYIWVGCATGHPDTTNNHYSITRNGKFSLKNKFSLRDTSLLSVDRYYRFSCGNRWMKFYRDGRVFSGVELKSVHSFIKDTQSLAGYFELRNNQITVEISDGETGKDWSVLILKGLITGDTISFYKDHRYGSGRNEGHFTSRNNLKKCTYIKTHAYPFATPDW